MKKFFYLLIAMLCCSIVGFAQNYSESFGTGNGDGRRMDNIDFITSRETKTINVNFDTNKTSYEIYNDSFVNEENKINIYKGETFDLTIKGNLNWIYTQVYIDWNCDGSFDESESGTEKLGFQPSTERNFGDNISEGNASSRTYNITVPDDALLGQTRVRVIMGWKQEDVSLVPDGETKEQQFITSTTIDNKKNAIVRDFLLEIREMPTRTITVKSNNAAMGNAVIASNGNSSITTKELGVSVTATTTEANLYTFEYWSDNNGNIVSKENPFIYTGENDITLTANFNYGPYPEMKRKYQAANQQNRYLKKVSYFIGNEEKTVFEATTQAELPYTAMPTPETTATTVGALIDKTATKIVLPQGTTEFDMKFKMWNEAIDGNDAELQWTKQAYYIDFDHSLDFTGATDGVNEISASTEEAAGDGTGEYNDNNFDDPNGSVANGWTRTISLPSSLQPGTYRMRVVYLEPGDSYGADWNEKLFTTTFNGAIRNGIAYDFDIVIEGTEPAGRTVTVNANPTEGGSVKITSPADIKGSTVETSEPVTVVAEANPGYRFINWTNGQGTVSTNPEYTYNGSTDVTLTANFEKIVNRTLKTIKTTLGSDGNFSGSGYIVRGNIPSSIIGDSNEMTMGAWVKIGSPNEGGIDEGYYDWGHNDGSNTNLGKIVMGTRQNNITGFGSKPSFGVVVYGVNSTNDAYKLGVFMKEDAISTPIEVPTGWFHLAFTINYNGTNTEMKMYVNGEYKTSATLNGKFASLADFQDFCFGDNMNAEFDDIMIWKKVLDAEKIKSSMKGLADNQFAYDIYNYNFVGYYTCDDLTDEIAESNNLADKDLTSGTGIKLRRDKMTYNNASGQWATCSKSLYTETGAAAESERQIPRGGAKFYLNNIEIPAKNWEKNGDENFGYLVNSPELTHLAYNGIEEPLAESVLAVYHNGDPGLPTFVKNSDIITNDDLAVAQVQYSYVVAGLEYTMTMPSVAKTEWMPISLPVDVDLVSDGTYILRPGYNFWYAQVRDDYTSIDSENGIWKTVKSDTENYLLKPGIISVPDARKGHSFTFYTKLDVPVVIRSYNREYNKTLMPDAGTIKYIRNPYSYEVNSLNVAGIYPEDGLKGESITVYKYNSVSGNFDPVSKEGNINTDPTNRLKAFEPFFVHDSNNGVSQAPRYIGTKDVSGIVEFEAVYDVNVRGTENAVEVETFQNTEVQIYTLDGVMVAADEVEGTREFELPAGIYVVKTTVEGENKSFKVVVE